MATLSGRINRKTPPRESIERAADRVIQRFLSGDVMDLTMADIAVLLCDYERTMPEPEGVAS